MRWKPKLYCFVCNQRWNAKHACFVGKRYGWPEQAVFPVMANGRTLASNVCFVLALCILIACLVMVMWPAAHAKDRVGVGTDLFWQYHDDLFPSHYLPRSDAWPNGRVICSEAQAVKELNRAGIETED